MKKSILTFAVFSLVVLTSFTTVNYTGDDSGDDNGDPTTTTTARPDSGGQTSLGTTNDKKKDVIDNGTIPYNFNSNSQNINFSKKSDF